MASRLKRYGFAGRREWAEEHARRLQSLVGTQEAGATVSAILALPYAASRRRWHYSGRPDLGEFDRALMLPDGN